MVKVHRIREGAKLPERGGDVARGFVLRATQDIALEASDHVRVPMGFALEAEGGVTLSVTGGARTAPYRVRGRPGRLGGLEVEVELENCSLFDDVHIKEGAIIAYARFLDSAATLPAGGLLTVSPKGSPDTRSQCFAHDLIEVIPQGPPSTQGQELPQHLRSAIQKGGQP